MPVPINPNTVANARPLPQGNWGAIPIDMCKTAPDGMKCLPIQIPYNLGGSPDFIVDLGAGNPPPLSQICSMYVDARYCDDILIIFEDTGYQIYIEGGNTQLFPVITGKGTPRFYVISPNGQSQLTNVANIFALNQFVPEFGLQQFLSSDIFGTTASGINRSTVPISSYIKTSTINLTVAAQSIHPTLLSSNIVVNGLQIYLYALAATPALEFRVITIKNNGNLMWQLPVIFTNVEQVIKVIEVGQLHNVYPQASVSTNLTVEIDSISNLTVKTLYCNVQASKVSSIA